MPENANVWLALVGGGIAMGMSIVCLLVVRKTFELPMAVVGIAAAGVVGAALNALARSYGRIDATVYALLLGIGAIIGGYSLGSTIVGRLKPHTAALSLPDLTTQPNAGSAVIVLACAEPETYDPHATALTLARLEDEELIEASTWILPFMFAAAKARYNAQGGLSPTLQQLREVARGLEQCLGPADPTITTATCIGPSSLAATIGRLAEENISRFTVVQLTVAESLHMAAAKRAVDALRPEEHGVAVRYTPLLWDADRLARVVVRKVGSLASGTAEMGVVLLGHGQPDEQSKRNQAYDENETVFLNRVRAHLIDEGLDERNIRIAWSEWREPTIASQVRHLAALGCTRIVVEPACFALDSLGTMLDLPMAIRQARLSQEVSIVVDTPWRADGDVIAELRERVLRATGGEA